MDTERAQCLAKAYFPGAAGGFGRDEIDKIDTGQKEDKESNRAEKPYEPDIPMRVAILYVRIDMDVAHPLQMVFIGVYDLCCVPKTDAQKVRKNIFFVKDCELRLEQLYSGVAALVY